MYVLNMLVTLSALKSRKMLFSSAETFRVCAFLSLVVAQCDS